MERNWADAALLGTGRSPSLEVRISGNASACLPTLHALLLETENAKLIASLPWTSGYPQHQLARGQEQVIVQLCAPGPAGAGRVWEEAWVEAAVPALSGSLRD